MHVEALLKGYQEEIDRKIASSLQQFEDNHSLNEACRYALMNGGKRIRPTVVLMVGETLDPSRNLWPSAFAVECFHTASLIADDLPCMDNEEERRAHPTVHKRYGEATAILATYALIAEGYRQIAHNHTLLLPTEPVFRLAIEAVSKSAGVQGAAKGQFDDLNAQRTTSLSEFKELFNKKTSALFELSFVLGWLFGGGTLDKLTDVQKMATHFGCAFQIFDDLRDQEKDREKGGLNVANEHGEAIARSWFEKELCCFALLARALCLNEGPLDQLLQSAWISAQEG